MEIKVIGYKRIGKKLWFVNTRSEYQLRNRQFWDFIIAQTGLSNSIIIFLIFNNRFVENLITEDVEIRMFLLHDFKLRKISCYLDE